MLCVTLARMSLSATGLIAFTALLRALFGKKLPRRTFIALWDAAMLRLLVPLCIPWRFAPRALLGAAGPSGGSPRSRSGSFATEKAQDHPLQASSSMSESMSRSWRSVSALTRLPPTSAANSLSADPANTRSINYWVSSCWTVSLLTSARHTKPGSSRSTASLAMQRLMSV